MVEECGSDGSKDRERIGIFIFLTEGSVTDSIFAVSLTECLVYCTWCDECRDAYRVLVRLL